MTEEIHKDQYSSHLCKQFMYKTKCFFIYIRILSLLILNCHVITLLNFNMVFPWKTQGKQLELRLQSLINFVYICNFPFQRNCPLSETQLPWYFFLKLPLLTDFVVCWGIQRSYPLQFKVLILKSNYLSKRSVF